MSVPNPSAAIVAAPSRPATSSIVRLSQLGKFRKCGARGLSSALLLVTTQVGCFLLGDASEADAPVICAEDEVLRGEACEPLPCDDGLEREPDTGACVPGDDLVTETCEGHACGFVTKSGILCTEACGRWERVEGLSPTLQQRARQDGCFARDEATGRFVLFGGDRKVSTNPVVTTAPRDTWELDVSDPRSPVWTEVLSEAAASDENSPTSRRFAACTSLPGGGVLLFGGQGIA